MTPSMDAQSRCPDCHHPGWTHPGPRVQGAVCFGERCRCERQTGVDGFSFPAIPPEDLTLAGAGEGVHLPPIPAQASSGRYGRSSYTRVSLMSLRQRN
jgi:hypothetical protein